MNKPFMETVPCSISTLSPVHIGCGEDYYPTNYVIDDGFLHHFGEDGLLAALNKQEKDSLADLAEKASLETNKNQKSNRYLQELQSSIYQKKEKLRNYASHIVPVSEQLESFYNSRIGRIMQDDDINKLGIARHVFNPYTNQPYFPGSSIKGAIRTAILNAINNSKELQTILDELGIKNQQGGRFVADEYNDLPRNSKVSDKLQKHLLMYRNITEDPLRLLKISDANYKNPDNLHSLEIRFALNRRVQEVKSYQIVECLPANRSCCLNFDVSLLSDISHNYRWNIQQIVEDCNNFFLPQLESELNYLEECNFANSAWITGVKELLQGEWFYALKEKQAMLLRIGRYGGAESNTLDGTRHIKIKPKKNQRTKYLPKPTTTWLAGDNKSQMHDLLPFGWVLVEIGDTDLKQTAQFLKTQAAGDYQKQQQLQALAEQRAKFLAQDQQRRELKAKQEAETAEKERLQAEAEAQKAAQLANMSEAQKLIFELQEEFEKSTPQNQPVGGTLNPKLTALINQAMNWSSEDKQALFNLGTEINKTLWGNNKNVKKRLTALQG